MSPARMVSRAPGAAPRVAMALVAFGVLLPLAPSSAAAQTIGEWLNDRIDEVVAARLAQRGSGRQTEAPAIARGSTTLVNHASHSGLVGAALDLLPAAGGDDAAGDTRTTAFTLTPYAVLSALTGRDPDDPFHYQRNDGWRSVALTLGTEEVDSVDGGSPAALVGLKIRLWSQQSMDPSSAMVQRLRDDLGLAGTAFGDLNAAVQDSLFAWVGDQVNLGRGAFINRLSNDPASLQVYLNLAGPEREERLLAMIAEAVEPFVRVRTAANAVVEELRGRPQLALDAQSRLRETGRDELRIGLTLDLGLTDRTQWTLNGAATVMDAPGDTTTAWGATVASGLKIALGPDRMVGPDPLALDLAFEGQFVDEVTPVWRLQGKLTVPVLEGVELPVSVTWASRTDLVEEDDVIGRVGFTVDTSRLLGR